MTAPLSRLIKPRPGLLVEVLQNDEWRGPYTIIGVANLTDEPGYAIKLANHDANYTDEDLDRLTWLDYSAMSVRRFWPDQ